MAKLSRELSPGLLHPREDLFAVGNLGALNAEVVVDCDGTSTVSLSLRGTFNMHVEVSGTMDGTNYVLIPIRPIGQAAIAYTAVIAGTAQGIWVGKCAAFTHVRVRVTAFTSGMAVATLVTSNALLDDSTQGMVTPLLVTATGAAAAAVTLTLPNTGAGLRHYLTYISINRSASVALTAGAAPVVVTTTNIPGALAFTLGADAAPQGTDKIIREDFAYPLAASAQATATTIICPATTGVIWRVTAGYYIAP